MTLPEFKAWFEGFTEDMSDRPTAKQWKRVQERVAEINGQAVTYPVYIDRYVRPLQPYWGQPYGAAGGVGLSGYGTALSGGTGAGGNALQATSMNMADVGRADKASLS